MTTEEIYKFIKRGKDHIESYNTMVKLNYCKDLIDLVYFVDFNIDVTDLAHNIEEREKRKYQRELRNLALDKYSNKCVISGENKIRLLETAHIKSVKDCDNINEKKDIDNVLLLWVDIHKYFDDYQISINPDTCMVEVNDLDEDNDWMQIYNGIKIECNDRMKKYIRHHYSIFIENSKN